LPLEQFQNAAPAASYLSVTQIICPHLAAAGTDRGICDLLVEKTAQRPDNVTELLLGLSQFL